MTDHLTDYATSTTKTPQDQPIPGRTDMVRNRAGGWTFQVEDHARLRRFLILGSADTYYASAPEMTADNADVLHRLLASDGPRVVDTIVEVSEAGAAPKQHPTMFALALATAKGDDATKRAAWDAVPRVCRTGTHLFLFSKYAEALRGWGRGHRRGVAAWYERDAQQVAFQAVKYRSREGWTHRDLLRLAHPTAPTDTHRAVYDFICGRDVPAGVLPIVDGYRAVNEPDCTPAAAAAQIRDNRLPWEALPDRLVNEKDVWDALLDHTGPTAVMRNLPRLTRMGLIGTMGPVDPRITRLTDVDVLRKGRVHPITVLLALRTYTAGEGRGGRDWTPAPAVIDVLDAAFSASFGAVVPAAKRTLIGTDVSGSMFTPFSAPMTGAPQKSMGPLMMAEAACALAMLAARTEPQFLTGAFSTGFVPLPITGRTTLAEGLAAMQRVGYGGTDVAAPMLWAAANRVEVDHFMVITDNETWAGRGGHPVQALNAYRQSTGIPARLTVMGMTATENTVADADDPGSLDVVGFDVAAPQVVADFARGDL